MKITSVQQIHKKQREENINMIEKEIIKHTKGKTKRKEQRRNIDSTGKQGLNW